jgi:hypothetical protein
MRRFILTIITAVSILFFTGCGNLSPRTDPRLDQKIDNQNGKIGQIESIQNGIKSEIGKIQQQADIQNSKLEKVQQGLFNLQSDNHGIMIFSGPGGLIAGIVLAISLVALIFHYRGSAITHEKTANILAEKLVQLKDPELEDSLFQTVMHTTVAANMLDLIKKKKLDLM